MARKLDTSIRGRRKRLIHRFTKREIETAVLDRLRSHGLDILADEFLEMVATDLVLDERHRRRRDAESRAIYARNCAAALKIAAE